MRHYQSEECRSGQITFSTATSGAIAFNVRGINDNVANGDEREDLFLVAKSDDATYDGMEVELAVRVLDNDVGGLQLDAPQRISEGTTGTLSLTLNTRPTSPVDVDLTVGNFEASRTFRPSDWDDADASDRFRTFDINVEHDNMQTGDQSLEVVVVASSDDDVYDGLRAEAIIVRAEIDTARLCIRNCISDDGSSETLPHISGSANEGGAAVTVRVRLSTTPAAPVELRLVLSAASGTQLELSEPLAKVVEEGGVAVDLAVAALADAELEGNQDYEVCVEASSADPFYAGLQRCATLTVVDNALVDVDFTLRDLPVDTDTGTRLLETFSGFSLTLPGSLDLETAGTVRQVESADVSCPPPAELYDPLLDTGHEYYALTELAALDSAGPAVITWPLAGTPSTPAAVQFVWAPLSCETDCDACEWQLQQGVEIDLAGGFAHVQTDHFSIWSLVQVRVLRQRRPHTAPCAAVSCHVAKQRRLMDIASAHR